MSIKVGLKWNYVCLYLIYYIQNMNILHVIRRSTRNFNIPVLGQTPGIPSFEFPPHPIIFYRRNCLANTPLRKNRRRLLWPLINLVYRHTNPCLVTPYISDAVYNNTT